MPTKKPRGQELTWEQHVANQALNQRRLRIEHVNSSVKVRFVGQKPNRKIELEDWPHVWRNTTTRHENLSPVSVEFRPPLVRG